MHNVDTLYLYKLEIAGCDGSAVCVVCCKETAQEWTVLLPDSALRVGARTIK